MAKSQTLFRSVVASAILLLSSQFAEVNAQRSKQQAINFVNEFKQAQDHRQEADKKLIDNMEIAADYLVQFRLRNGHFPEVGVEEEKASTALQNRLKPNPYTVTGVVSNDEKLTHCQLRFVHEIGLTDSQRQSWEKKIPPDWKGDPGCITIVMNEYNNILLWGAGADHAPIYDAKNNKYAFTWRTL